MQEIRFYKGKEGPYYTIDNNIQPVNGLTIPLIGVRILRSNVKLPYKISFTGYSKREIKTILAILYGVNMQICKTEIDNEYIIVQKKYRVGVYELPNKGTAYGRKYNRNPYELTEINGRRVLLEVMKEYVQENDGKFYFLEDELEEIDRKSFSEYYKELEVDYIYKMQDNEYYNEKPKKKAKIRKITEV